ncbi:MAG: DUF883 domain-containing protein [Oxalobacter sp.]|nr:MAG: DUF883 domain-containing protein [Oxalobacter sp.]
MGQSRDKLMADLRVVVRDAEELLTQAGSQAGEGFKAAKAKMEASLKAAKEELEYVESIAINKAKQVAHTTDDYVKTHPWQSVGMAAAIGVILGFLVSRK